MHFLKVISVLLKYHNFSKKPSTGNPVPKRRSSKNKKLFDDRILTRYISDFKFWLAVFWGYWKALILCTFLLNVGSYKNEFFGCATDRPTSRESLNDLLFSMRSRGERNGMRSFSNTREHLKPWWRVKCTVSRANANDVTVSDLFAGHFRNSRYSWIMGHLRHLQFVFWLILNVF